MFKTKYSGPIEAIGTGRLVSNWFVRRSMIRIGENKLRNVMASDDLDDFVETSVEDGDNVTLNVGWVMFYRWLLSAKNSSESTHQGVILFIAGMVTHIVLVGIAALIVGAIASSIFPGFIGPAIGFVAVGLVLATAVLNVKAWILT